MHSLKSGSSSSLIESKKLLRKSIAATLKSLDTEHIKDSSKECFTRLQTLSQYVESCNISIYLSMPKEVQTNPILQHAFSRGKNVYIPKITGPNAEDMLMLRLYSYEEIDAFPKNSWGIPEPEVCDPASIPFALVDLVIVPGVAFDLDCRRLGHGKGYYDSYMHRLNDQRKAVGLPPAITIGLALEQQIVDCVPVNENDVKLDVVVTSTRVIKK